MTAINENILIITFFVEPMFIFEYSKISYLDVEILIGFVFKLIFCKAIFLNFFFL